MDEITKIDRIYLQLITRTLFLSQEYQLITPTPTTQVPLAHLAASAGDEGRNLDERGIIVMMTGVGNTLGRLSNGFFADRIGVKLTAFCT